MKQVYYANNLAEKPSWWTLNKKWVLPVGTVVCIAVGGCLCYWYQNQLVKVSKTVAKGTNQNLQKSRPHCTSTATTTSVKQATDVISTVSEPIVAPVIDVIRSHPPVITEHASKITNEKAGRYTPVPYDVRMHIRNLPAGQHTSLQKIAEATENRINLEDGQTWVKGHTKGGVAA